MDLRVMTFNLRYDNSGDGRHAWPYRRDAVVEAIRTNNPDVICTQEGLDPMLVYLRDALPGYRMTGRGRDADGGGEHSAIFYRHSLLTVRRAGDFWFSPEPGTPGSLGWGARLPRICSWCELTTDESAHVRILNAHLDNQSEQARREGVRMIREMVRDVAAATPCIVCGDLNANPGSPEIALLCEGEDDPFTLHGCSDLGVATFHGFTGDLAGEQIDYIVGTNRVDFIARRVVTEQFLGVWPSDHFAVIADVRVHAR